MLKGKSAFDPPASARALNMMQKKCLRGGDPTSSRPLNGRGGKYGVKIIIGGW